MLTFEFHVPFSLTYFFFRIEIRNFISWTAWGGYFENIDYNWIKGSLFIKNLFEAARQNNEDVAEKNGVHVKEYRTYYHAFAG